MPNHYLFRRYLVSISPSSMKSNLAAYHWISWLFLNYLIPLVIGNENSRHFKSLTTVWMPDASFKARPGYCRLLRYVLVGSASTPSQIKSQAGTCITCCLIFICRLLDLMFCLRRCKQNIRALYLEALETNIILAKIVITFCTECLWEWSIIGGNNMFIFK